MKTYMKYKIQIQTYEKVTLITKGLKNAKMDCVIQSSHIQHAVS